MKPCLDGEATMVRYADDFICTFEMERDAKRFQDVLKKRLGRFSLELAEAKTKLLRFGRFAERDTKRFAYRWICRRSQKGRISLHAYYAYLQRNPLAGPTRLTDLISRGRQLAAAVQW